MFGIDPRAAKAAWTVALVALALYCLYLARATLFVFAIGLFVSYMIAPLVHLADRWRKPGVPYAVSVAIAFAIVLGAIAIVLILLGPSVVQQASQLADQIPRLAEKFGSGAPLPLPGWLEPWRDRITALLHQGIEGAVGSAIPFTRRLILGIGGFASDLIYIVIVPILAFLFLADREALRRGLVHWLAPLGTVETMVPLLSEVHHVLGRYVRALGLLSLATLVSYMVVFSLMGVPYGIVLGFAAAVLEFIPVIGPLAAFAIIMIVAAVAGFAHLVWVVVFIGLYRMFQDYMLSPRLMSGGAGVHPALVIFGFLAGEQIAGIPGMFLSVPIIATFIIIVKYRSRRHHGEPEPPPAHETLEVEQHG
jgi:predicted PurR-regulated permease PerM